MVNISTKDIEAVGIGRPDYSMEIDQIKRGETYPEFFPRENEEKYKIFYLTMIPGYALGSINYPLQVGETRNYLDIETNLSVPWSHGSGVGSDFREWFFSVSGAVGLTVYLDAIPIFYMYVTNPCSNHHQYEQIVWGKTTMLDPKKTSSHTWNFTLTNLAAAAITGTVHVAVVVST
jgi:hypothetical protein